MNSTNRADKHARELAAIAPPADCTGDIGDWHRWDLDVFARGYTGTVRQIVNTADEPIRTAFAGIDVTQYSTGRIDRRIYCGGNGLDGMDAKAARDLAAVLLDAADEIDALDGGATKIAP